MLAGQEIGPLALADFGSFYAGGRQAHIAGRPVREIAFTKTASLTYDPNGLYHVEQAYVQYFIPAERRHPLPLVLLHGGGMTLRTKSSDGACVPATRSVIIFSPLRQRTIVIS